MLIKIFKFLLNLLLILAGGPTVASTEWLHYDAAFGSNWSEDLSRSEFQTSSITSRVNHFSCKSVKGLVVGIGRNGETILT